MGGFSDHISTFLMKTDDQLLCRQLRYLLTMAILISCLCSYLELESQLVLQIKDAQWLSAARA